MNETITLSRLISRLAAATGTDANTSRRFLRELLNTIRENLQAGEAVNIDGFGTFAASEDGSEVLFVPDEGLAAEVNRPFAMFQPVRLAPDLTPDDLNAVDEEAEAEVVEAPEEETVAAPETEVEEAPEDVPAPAPEAEVVEESVETVKIETPEVKAEETHTHRPVPSFPEEEEAPLHVHPHSHYYHQRERKKQKGRAWLWFAGAATVIGCAGGYFAGTLMDINDFETTTVQQNYEQPAVSVVEEEVTEQAPEEAEVTEQAVSVQQESGNQASQNSQASQTAAEPVYDVVDGNNYLSVIAHRHYGVRNYWVFIYEANRDVIQNPNVIAPGTRVVIPPRESLPGSTEEERRQIAARKIGELSRR